MKKQFHIQLEKLLINFFYKKEKKESLTKERKERKLCKERKENSYLIYIKGKINILI